MYKAIKVSVISVLLSACGGGGGGDSSPSATVYTGTFIDSAVEGLHYSTPSRSGLTDANGEFEYLAGETISFSLGATMLGVTTGDGSSNFTVTPFSIYGIEPVTNETEISSSLNNDEVGSFERALNLAMLLQTFDTDGNPENGIDLGDAHTALSETTINLFTKATEFLDHPSMRDAKRRADIEHDRDMLSSVEHLYSSLELQIESSQDANVESIIDRENIQSSNFEYNADGQVLVEQTDTNGDGTFNLVKQYQYDANGNVTQIDNSAAQTTETMEYDGDNNLLRRLTVVEQGSSTLEIYNYNQQGKVQRFELDRGNDGNIDSTTRYHYEGSRLTGYEIDNNGDTVADAIATYIYDNGLLVTYSEDQDNNGTPELIIAYSYDAQGNRQSHNITVSSDGSPSAPGNFIYDQHNNVIGYEIDRDLDGQTDYREAYTYNANNQRTSYSRDTNGDGAWDKVSQYYYNKNGKRIQMAEDTDGNGIADKVWAGSYEPAIIENAWSQILSKL